MKLVKAVVLGLLCSAGLLGLASLLVDAPRLSTNDLHMLWLVSPERFFVPVPNDTGDGFVMTNPQLMSLDNGKTVFSAKKEKGVFRIFCVGGSTTRGWPFHARFSYPELLSRQLSDVLPGRSVEVINAGLMASSSTNDLSLVREIMSYEPDLLLVYEGRNESDALPFYDGWRARLLPVHGWFLRRSRLYRLARYALAPDAGFDHAEAVRYWTASGLGPDQESALHRRLLGNLAAMDDEARRHRCALALMTQALEPGEDSRERINAVVRRFSEARGIPLIDIGRVFQDSGDSRRIFLSHASHPDLSGYLLMTRTILRGVAKDGLIAPPGAWRWERLQPDLDSLARLSVTPGFLAGVYSRLSFFYTKIGFPGLARTCSSRARDLRSRGMPALRALLTTEGVSAARADRPRSG
jgi:hypothetical protein